MLVQENLPKSSGSKTTSATLTGMRPRRAVVLLNFVGMYRIFRFLFFCFELQLFRTEKRGWGIRCLDDIPKGEFICVYAGQLLTDQEANDDGKQLGDEYLAELGNVLSFKKFFYTPF